MRRDYDRLLITDHESGEETQDGMKVSAKGQLIVREEWCYVPVVYAKKGVKLVFNLWLPLNGRDARCPSTPPR